MFFIRFSTYVNISFFTMNLVFFIFHKLKHILCYKNIKEKEKITDSTYYWATFGATHEEIDAGRSELPPHNAANRCSWDLGEQQLAIVWAYGDSYKVGHMGRTLQAGPRARFFCPARVQSGMGINGLGRSSACHGLRMIVEARP